MPVLQPLGGMFQLGYVTHDFDLALAMLKDKHGVEPDLIFNANLDLRTPKDSFVNLKVALAWLDNCMIEIIEPVDGYIQPYMDTISGSRSVISFHHLGTLVDCTREEWDSFIDSHRASLIFDGGRQEMRYAYLDCRSTIGHYLEYVWMEEGFLAGNDLWNAYRGRQASLGNKRKF